MSLLRSLARRGPFRARRAVDRALFRAFAERLSIQP